MDQITFRNDIYNIFQLINKGTEGAKTFIDVKLISKQYLAYYLYRIVCKHIRIFEQAVPSNNIADVFLLLKIPREANKSLCYPMAGKMTNDEKMLDIIILSFIQMFEMTLKYISTIPNVRSFKNFLDLITSKDIKTIVQDLIDLQKLLPGLSVSAIRPSYLSDNKINSKNNNAK